MSLADYKIIKTACVYTLLRKFELDLSKEISKWLRKNHRHFKDLIKIYSAVLFRQYHRWN
jgi:hypothetical protein